MICHDHKPEERGALDETEDDREVSGVFVDFFPPRLTFLFQFLQRFINRAEQLQNDRGRNIGHDAQGEDGRPGQPPAHEHVVDPQEGVDRHLTERGLGDRLEHTLVVEGVERLTGAPVRATDLRAGAALVVAGLMADGQTEISGVKYIDRGYDHIEEKFISLGADITRKKVPRTDDEDDYYGFE